MTKLKAGLLTIGLLSACVSAKAQNISDIVKKTYSETMLEAGIVAGKIDTKDYSKYDSTSNNYSVFILSEINNQTEYFNQQDRGLHRKVEEDSIVYIVHRLVYENNKYTGFEVEKIVTKGEAIKSGLLMQYHRSNGLNIKKD